MAVGVGFEPTKPCEFASDFESGALPGSATPPPNMKWKIGVWWDDRIRMNISNHLREIMTAKLPDANLEPYFSFIESLPILKTGDKHHILPKEEFPEQKKDPNNIVHVSSENHFKASGVIAFLSGTLDKARHTRWHTNRGIVNSECFLCQKDVR
jgi:hypothetical protein